MLPKCGSADFQHKNAKVNYFATNKESMADAVRGGGGGGDVARKVKGREEGDEYKPCALIRESFL